MTFAKSKNNVIWKPSVELNIISTYYYTTMVGFMFANMIYFLLRNLQK